MKKNHWFTLIGGIAIGLGIYAIPAITQSTTPQQPSAAAPPTRVVVVDLFKLIQHHPDHVKRQEQLKESVNKAEAAFAARQEALINEKKLLDGSGLRPGSPEHQKELDALNAKGAAFQADIKTQGMRFESDNAKIMYDTFQNIKSTIDRISRAHGIAQVTDYRQFEVNPTIPEMVAEDMDQRLVWFNPSLDITATVLQQLYADRNMQMPQSAQNALAPARATAGAPATGAR